MENKKKMSMFKKQIYYFNQSAPSSINFKEEMPFDRYTKEMRR